MIFKAKILNTLLLMFLCATAQAAPSALTYQGRILKTDGTPLEYNNVSFIFQITDIAGSCVIYQEQVDGYDMTNSGGVFDTAIGSGTHSFPPSGTFTVLDAFKNGAVLGCSGGSTITPALDAGRMLRVRFYDGAGWKTISPDNIIRSVPYSGYAASSARLGDNLPTDFVLKTGIPTCSAGTFLSWDGTTLNCTGVVGAAGGTVTDVSSSNAYISIANSSSTPSLTLNVGTVAGTVAAGNDSRITGALQTGATAGGDLSGTYPNPTVAKLQGTAVSALAPTSGNFLKYNGTNWADTAIAISDVASLSTALAGKPDYTQFPVCTAAQSLTFISPVGGFSCTTIAIAGSQVTGDIAGNAAGFTGTLVGDVSGTQGATSVDKIKGTAVTITTITSGDYLKYNGTAWVNSPLTVSGSSFGSQAANQVLASPDGTTGNPSFRSLVAADLPTSVTNGLWTAASGDVYRTSGKVGIGTNAPGVSLDIGTKTDAVALPSGTTAQRPGTPVNGYTRYNTDMKGLEAYINGSWQQVSAGTSPTASEDGKTLRWNNTTKQFDWFTAGAAGAGIATLNGSSQSSQSFVTGTSGTDFGISTNTGTGVHTFNIPTASATNRGALSSTDWATFNGKQDAGNYLTALTGDVTAAGPGSAAASVDKIKGVALDMTGIASGNFLKYNGTAWVPSALPAGNAGTVTDVSSTNSYLSVANGTNAAALTLNVGAVANTVAAGDDARIVNAIQNAGGAVSIQSGLDAAKGSPSLDGRIYIATDTQKIYRDNGSALVVVASAGAGGTVTSVSGNGPISVATGTTTPVISISQAATGADGYLTSGDWNIFNTKLSAVTNTANLANTKIWIGDAGGKAQEFPFTGNVSLTAGGVTKVTAIQNIPVSATAPTADGQVLRNVSGTWTPGFISMFDLRSTVTGSATFGSGATGCTASQTLTWTSATDNLACTPIAIADSQLTYGTKTANTVFAGPTSGGAAAPTFRALVAADLPAGIASQWLTNVNDIYYNTGNVGIGTAAPAYLLQVKGSNPAIGFYEAGSSTDLNLFATSTGLNLRKGGTTYYQFNTSGDGLGIGTSPITGNSITMSAGAKIGTNRVSSNNTTLEATGGTVGGTNQAGGTLILKSGISTGTGASNIDFYTSSAGSSGTTDNAQTVKMSILGNGYVGIGTAAPAGPFEVQGGKTATWLGTGAKINLQGQNGYNGNGGDVVIMPGYGTDASSTPMTAPGSSINQRNGFIGIGTSSPAYPIDIQGGVSKWVTAGSSIMIAGQNGNNSAGGNVIVTGGYSTNAGGSNTGTYANIILNPSGGSVGIGSTGPATKLDVVGSIRIGDGGETCGATYTGAIRYNSSVLQFCNGTSWTTLSAGGTVVGAGAGTNAAPSLSFSGDPDTGFYDTSSNNTISVAAGGAKIFDISSAGIVSATAGGGIVTTANGDATAPTFSFSGDPDTGWFHPAANTLAASTGGTERVRIDSVGNVGIGSTGPSAFVDIQAGSALRHTAILNVDGGTSDWGTGGGITLKAQAGAAGNNNGGNILVQAGAAAGTGVDGKIQLATNGGIGGNKVIVELPYAGFSLQSNDSAHGVWVKNGKDGVANKLDLVEWGDIRMFAGYNNGGNTSPRMTIQSGGEVGIGTAAPAQILDVYKSTNAAAMMQITNDNTGTSAYTDIDVKSDVASLALQAFSSSYSTASVAGYARVRSAAASNGLIVESGGAKPLLLNTNGVERMRVDSVGNVGIGTNSPLQPLEVIGQAKFGGIELGATGAYQTFNAYYNGGWKYRATDYAYLLRHDGSDLSFSTAPSGTGGTTPTWTTTLALSGGNVGIGTVSPSKALDIYGTNNSSHIHLTQTSGSTGGATLYLANYRDTSSTTGPSFMGMASRGTLASPSPLLSGDDAFYFTGQGATDSAWAVRDLAKIVFAAAENISNSSSAGMIKFYTTTSGSTTLTEKMRIEANGNVGIGTVSAGYRLDIVSATGTDSINIRRVATTDASSIKFNPNGALSASNVIYYAGIQPNTSNYSLNTWNGTAWNEPFTITPSGSIGVGNTIPGALLHVGSSTTTAGIAVAKFQTATGTCTMTPATSGTGIACSSDERLKKDIQDVTGEFALDRLIKLQAVNYIFRKDPSEQRHTGYIAQKVKEIAPEFVRQDDDGLYQIYYDGLVPWITEAIKALYVRITSTDTHVQALSAVTESQSREIASIKAQADREKAAKDLQIQKLERENAELKARMDKIEKMLAK